MSTTGTRLQKSRVARPDTDARAEQENPAGPPPSNTPFWLLWSTGIIAFVLCVVAFALWGINGTSTLFDMIVALCT